MKTSRSSADGLFCGECGNDIVRGPFTVITTDDEQRVPRWLCVPCAEVCGLIIGHDYSSGECPCNGDARHHGYLYAKTFAFRHRVTLDTKNQ